MTFHPTKIGGNLTTTNDGVASQAVWLLFPRKLAHCQVRTQIHTTLAAEATSQQCHNKIPQPTLLHRCMSYTAHMVTPLVAGGGSAYDNKKA